jgi:hypothetical protein
VAYCKAHPIFTSMLVVGVVLRLMAWLAYEPALMLQKDAYGYVERTDPLRPSPWWPAGYSIFLWPWVQLGNLSLVSALQHVMGFGLGVTAHVRLREIGVGPVGAAVAAGPILLDAYQVNIEQYLLAETLMIALTLGAILLVVRLSRPTPIVCAIAGLGVGMAGIVRFTAFVIIVPLVIYLLFRKVGWRVLVSLAAFALPIIAYMFWYSSIHGDFAVSTRQGYWMYPRVMSFAQCSRIDPPPAERPLCDDETPLDERPWVGFYMYHRASPINDVVPPPGLDREDVMRQFAIRAIRNQPIDYLHVVVNDVAHAFSFGRKDGGLNLWRFPLTFDDVQPRPQVVRQYRGSPPEWAHEGRFEINRSLAVPLRAYQSFGYVWGPMLGFLFALGIAGFLLPSTTSVRVACIVFWLCGAMFLVLPFATLQFDYRYILPSVPFIGIAGGIGVDALSRRRRTGGQR